MKNKQILLIITGGIACYKSLELLRLLQKENYIVNIVLSDSASHFITSHLVKSLSTAKVYTQLFGDNGMDHIELSRQADLIIIAPATADFLAKMACGLANDLASAVMLANQKPTIIAPAMNSAMWHNLATQKNLAFLQQNELLYFLPPKSGLLACQENGIGKMWEPSEIYQTVNSFFDILQLNFNNNTYHLYQKALLGKKIIITAGSTQENIDVVRFIGNKSSGKQAIAIATILHHLGAEVLLIYGNVSQEIPHYLSTIQATTAKEMLKVIQKNMVNTNVFIACAAVADFKIKNPSQQKIKKQNNSTLTLHLEPNPDILQIIGSAKNRPEMIIGFAAESENILEFAKQKLITKNCNLIVANNIENGNIFGCNNTDAFFVTKEGNQKLGKITKQQLAIYLAQKILSHFETL
jgi:phosphopantothenoylcysteine decarboxylase/phosphopantothenate--cysteine ligase